MNSLPYNHEYMDSERAGETFSHDVQAALLQQSADELRQAFASQPTTKVTRAISARISAQEFMRTEKEALAACVEQVDQTGDFENTIRALIVGMDEQFHQSIEEPYQLHARSTKYSDETVSSHLRGDEMLRNVVATMDDEKMLPFMQHVATMSVDKLMPPDEIADWMWNDVRQSIVDRLWEVVQDYRTEGASDVVKQSFQREVTTIMDDLNQQIPGSMLR